ncbi:MAG: hypothetical protein ACK48U_06045, partial [Planctomyces sp.]
RWRWRNGVGRGQSWQPLNAGGGRVVRASGAVIWKKCAAQPWFHHEVTKVERPEALPEGLSR